MTSSYVKFRQTFWPTILTPLQIGNVYGMLVAGHGIHSLFSSLPRSLIVLLMSLETTGHTLAVCLGLLGLYQEEQELVYQNIVDVVGYEREPVRPTFSVAYHDTDIYF